MPPDFALWLTLISSNYPCLEHIFMVPACSSHWSSTVFGYKVVKHLHVTSWPHNELVKLTMLWTTGPRSRNGCKHSLHSEQFRKTHSEDYFYLQKTKSKCSLAIYVMCVTSRTALHTDTWGQLVLLTTTLNNKTCINTSRQVLEKTIFAINAIFTQDNNLSKTKIEGSMQKTNATCSKCKTNLIVWGQNPERKVTLNILGTSWQPVSIGRKFNSEQYLGGCQLEIFDLYGAPCNRR